MRPPANPTKHTRPAMSVARLRKKASKRPPTWQYGMLIGLFLLCVVLALTLVIKSSGRTAPSPLATTPAISVTPSPATAASMAGAPSQQPAGTASAVPTYPTTVAAATTPTYTPPGLTYGTGGSSTSSSTPSAGMGVALSTPVATTMPADPDSPVRHRPLAAAARG
jgi:hypothetical protein